MMHFSIFTAMWQCLRFCFAISALSLLLPMFAQARSDDYVMGPGDRLRLRVYPDEELNVELRIGADGHVIVPFLGAVTAAGKTIVELSDELYLRFRGDYYIDPIVELMVEEHVAHRVYVLGAVKTPGAQPLNRNDRVLDLLQRAGGLAGKNAGYAYIFSAGTLGAEAPEVQRVSLQRIFQNADFSENVAISNGQTIYIFDDERIFVMGAVQNPGAYQATEGSSLLRAVAVAGGFTPRANENKVWIYRGGVLQGTSIDAQELIKDNRPDPPLQPGDMVFVPQRFF